MGVVCVLFFFLFLFLICFDLIQVKMQFTESLTGGFEVSKKKIYIEVKMNI